jgi:chitin synthase
MKELDDSFQETVKRALTPWKEDTTPEKRDMDVSQLLASLSTLGRAEQQDQNRTFRTRLVIAWLLSNAGLAIVISSINGLDQTKLLVEACLPGGDAQLAEMNRTCIVTALNTDSREVQSKQQVYFKYLLWATFGLSSVRFIGVSSSPHALGRQS